MYTLNADDDGNLGKSKFKKILKKVSSAPKRTFKAIKKSPLLLAAPVALVLKSKTRKKIFKPIAGVVTAPIRIMAGGMQTGFQFGKALFKKKPKPVEEAPAEETTAPEETAPAGVLPGEEAPQEQEAAPEPETYAEAPQEAVEPEIVAPEQAPQEQAPSYNEESAPESVPEESGSSDAFMEMGLGLAAELGLLPLLAPAALKAAPGILKGVGKLFKKKKKSAPVAPPPPVGNLPKLPAGATKLPAWALPAVGAAAVAALLLLPSKGGSDRPSVMVIK